MYMQPIVYMCESLERLSSMTLEKTEPLTCLVLKTRKWEVVDHLLAPLLCLYRLEGACLGFSRFWVWFQTQTHIYYLV